MKTEDNRYQDDIGNFKKRDEAPKTRKALRLLVWLLLFLSVGGGAFLYYRHYVAVIAAKNQDASHVFFYKLPETVVNLDDGSGLKVLMKFQITLEVNGSDKLKAIKAMEPKIIDVIQVYMKGMRSSDVRGALAVYKMKEALLWRVNTVLGEEAVENILFGSLVMQ